MRWLLAVLRAAHLRHTHHRFAIDALSLVQTEAGRRLARWLVRYHGRYLAGALDPDVRFRDYHNHFVQVRDGYWGGAPRVAHQWYDRLQRYLRRDRWSDAAHAAGVLSHYFTDPIDPLHTDHCEREALLHRPIEWSISCAYEALFRRWQEDDTRIVFQLADGPSWLGEAILHSARLAHRRYETLLDRYRLEEALRDPPAGLDRELQSLLAGLIGLAVTGWARVLERAARDAELIRGGPLPQTSLASASAVALLRIPDRRWVRWRASRRERQAVEALVAEYRLHGHVRSRVPAEVDVVQRVLQVREAERRWRDTRERVAEPAPEVLTIGARPQSADEPFRRNHAPESGKAVRPRRAA